MSNVNLGLTLVFYLFSLNYPQWGQLLQFASDFISSPIFSIRTQIHPSILISVTLTLLMCYFLVANILSPRVSLDLQDWSPLQPPFMIGLLPCFSFLFLN